MPKAPYTRKHQLLLQVIMWAIFGLCMGMAALVTAKHRSAYWVELAPAVKLGPFNVQVPKGWKSMTGMQSGAGFVDAEEPKSRQHGQYPRRFRVFVEKLDEQITPNVYLLTRPQVGYQVRGGIWSYFQTEGERRNVEHEFRPYTLLGVEGVQAGKVDSEGWLRIFACSVVPDEKDPAVFWAVTVRYNCDEGYTPADKAAFKQVTDAISLTKN